MAGEFTITTTTSMVRLDSKRQGQALFTVFNKSGRRLRARAKVVSVDPAAETWLTLHRQGADAQGQPGSGTGGTAGEVAVTSREQEQDFDIAGAQQYVAQIVVTPTAPAGSYSLRLDMVGVENPDEQLTRGDTVTFEVPPPVAVKKAFPWWIPVGALVALLLIGSVLGFVLTRDRGGDDDVTPTPTTQPRVGADRYIGQWINTNDQADGLSELVIDRGSGNKLFVQAFTRVNNKTNNLGITSGTFKDDPFAPDPLNAGFSSHRFTITANANGSVLTVIDIVQVGNNQSTVTATFNRARRLTREIDPRILRGVLDIQAPTAAP